MITRLSDSMGTLRMHKGRQTITKDILLDLSLLVELLPLCLPCPILRALALFAPFVLMDRQA